MVRLKLSGAKAGFAAVLFFKRTLNFNPESAAKSEPRDAQRYPMAADSPRRAHLPIAGRRLPATFAHLSGTGVIIVVAGVENPDRGTLAQLEIALDAHSLVRDVQEAHAQPGANREGPGLQLRFADFDTIKAPCRCSNPWPSGPVSPPGTQTRAGKRARHDCHGLPRHRRHPATVWRAFAGQAIEGFAFRMHDFFVRSGTTPPALDILTCEEQTAEHKLGDRVPALQRSGEENAEIRRLFH